MQEILNFVTKVKSGDRNSIRLLLINGFDEQLLNELALIPAAYLSEIEQCFSLSIDGKKLTKQVKKIASLKESENRIYRAIELGCSLKFAQTHFGIRPIEFTSIRKSFKQISPPALSDKNYNEIYQEYEALSHLNLDEADLYIKLCTRLMNNHDLEVPIKTLCGICDE